jgi:hypothetical protein
MGNTWVRVSIVQVIWKCVWTSDNPVTLSHNMMTRVHIPDSTLAGVTVRARHKHRALSVKAEV